MNLVRPCMFGNRNTSRILRVDPTGLTLPTFVLNKVYAIDDAPGNIVLAQPADDALILGFYVGVDAGGFLLFEQERLVIEAAFTARGTRWYLAADGELDTVASEVLMGVAIDEDSLMILGSRIPAGGGPPPA